MPFTPAGILVDPAGSSVTVTITEPGGPAVTAYTSKDGGTPLALPAVITVATEFWLPGLNTYQVSVVGPAGEGANGAGGVALLDLTSGGVTGLRYGAAQFVTPTAAGASYPSILKKGGQDAQRGTRDRALRTFTALLADPAVANVGVHVVGHSIVAGTNASVVANRFTSLIGAKLSSARPGITVTVDGHGGFSSTALLANGVSANFAALPAGSVGCMIFMGVVNDPVVATPVPSATTQTNLASLFAAYRASPAAAPNMSILIIGEWLRSDMPGTGEPWSNYTAAMQAVADADPFTTILDMSNRFGQVAGNTLALFSDAVHPNDRGHAMLADLITGELLRGQVFTSLAVYSRQVFVDCTGTALANTNWANYIGSDSTAFLTAYTYSNGAAANDSISFSAVLAAGTYTADFWVGKQSNAGILSIYIDGVLQGGGNTIDLYSGSITKSKVTQTGFSIPTSGDHTITLTVTTKNGSSSGYLGLISAMKWTKTA